ncbi:3-oxoacyl-acyl-carrier protein reductase [Fusarium austroafricanum]|uniref:3-oxoacyl-acyl-carrier protein reductase n=1 Tax=Fusarium austroafricanum TaxID=2364996 RepID=A0A8H4KIG4_9HYPO|nr:3-oxoacyl-acyl-carrier protein reductase [Fusarium austroafricanum]
MSGSPPTLFPGVALVTGAASGIGRQVAISFAVEGCRKIALFDKNIKELIETKSTITAKAGEAEVLFFEVDNLEADEVTRNMTLVIAYFGRIDYAVNCAGIYGPTKKSHQVTPSEFDQVMNTNFRGLWLCAREELKSVYSASKAAIISLTRSDAIDYAKHQVRVNCVCPGVIETPMTADVPDDDAAVQTAVMRRKGTPQEVADAVLFLSSPKASFIQGAALSVDGGYTIS